jgi:SAM-dependent methyltransferase
MKPDFDRIARPYRWLEYLSFGPMLEHCRFYRLTQLTDAQRALVLGDGDGRFIARLLQKNPSLHADILDLSPVMLQILKARVVNADALNRVTLHCTDALEFLPAGSYDSVVTHFFLDCFSTSEVRNLAARIRCLLTPNASWVISEFAIPTGPMSLPAKLFIRSLYAAFGLLTGLKTRQLPDHSAALNSLGMVLIDRRKWLKGLLISELWQVSGN